MSQPKFDLSIVIPAYREAHRIGLSLKELAAFLKTDPKLKDLAVEVIVVSADSPDTTHKIIDQHAKRFANFKLLKPGKKVGKGRDVQVGMLAARGAAVVYMDADLATPLRYLPIFYKAFLAGNAVVFGTRNLRRHHPELWRRSLSIAGNLLFVVLCGIWTEDSQCGFKLFSYEAAQTCFSKMRIVGWGFDMEVLTIARVNGFTMQSHRITGWKSVAGGSFTDNALKSSLNSLQELFYIFWGRISGQYRGRRSV